MMNQKLRGRKTGRESYFRTLMGAMGSVDQGSYTYYDQTYGPLSPTEQIRKEAEEAEAAYDAQNKVRADAELAEAEYDRQMQIRREGEAAEAQYDAGQKKPVMATVGIIGAVIVVGFLLFRRS